MVSNKMLSQISFPDCEISFFKLSGFELEIHLDGIYTEEQGMVNAPVQLLLSNWKSLNIERFDSAGNNPTEINLSECGKLRDICEWVVENAELSFAGFERNSGRWQRFNLSRTEINIQIDG